MASSENIDLDELRARIAKIEAGASRASRGESGQNGPRRAFASSGSMTRRAPSQSDAEDGADKAVGGDPFSRIVRLLSVRDYASAELVRRLSREGYDSEEAEAAVARAVSCGLVDDLRFAESFARGRISRGRGVAGIERELSDLGIEASALPGWPDEFLGGGFDAEFDRAMALLERKPPRSKNVRESAYRRLISKGFSSDVSARAARTWSERRQS